MPAFAFRTNASHHIIDFPDFESFGKSDCWNMLLTQTEGAVTDYTSGVYMVTVLMVVRGTFPSVMPAVTYAVFVFSRAVIEEMEQLMFLEQSQRPEQRRTIHCRQLSLQFCGRESIRQFLYLPPNQQPHCRWANLISGQYLVGFHYSSRTR